jgi:thioredoxin-dependent peroxiredoxin
LEAVGAVVLGVSFDTPEDNQAFAERFHAPFPLLSDTSRRVGAAYDIVRGPDERSPGTPRRVTYLIDSGGVIRKVYVVKDIEAHPGQVLDDVRRVATAG